MAPEGQAMTAQKRDECCAADYLQAWGSQQETLGVLCTPVFPFQYYSDLVSSVPAITSSPVPAWCLQHTGGPRGNPTQSI